jgi:Ca2+-binding EF-hand superfamily protein
MTKFWSWILVAVVAGCITAGSALAADDTKKGTDKPKPTPEEVFKRLDKDGDGKVTLAEFTARAKDDQKKESMEKRFKAMDKDSKGFLTIDDLKAPPKGGKKKEK